MKVAIVGASGNAGTALLHALRAEPQVDEIVGIARRTPDAAPPYDSARWERVDIAAPAVDAAGDDRVIDQLAAAFAGADCVVHLAWLIQPNRKRELIRRANVDGTRRVIEACLRAGVGHLVCASSVGAYSPVSDDVRRDESWLAAGVPTSHYSVDKVAQEQILDEVAAANPDLVVSRLRPALIFQDEAGAEIVRYFLGPLVPKPLLRPGRLPVVPLPRGIRLQVVHADDVAQAYLQVVLRRAPGAFNVATEPVLHAPDLAGVVGRGRLVEVPPKLIRPVLSLAWQAHVVPPDAGWLDMGMGAPLMDTTRAREVLGWEPRHEAAETLAELLEGMAEGAGTPSVPMRPAGVPEQKPDDETSGRHRAAAAALEDVGVPPRLDAGLLGQYLDDHLTGATGGLSRTRRMAKAYADTLLGPDLDRLAGELAEEHTALREIIAALGTTRRPYRQAAAWVGEHVGRLKLNGRLVSRSPMSLLLELEIMRGAVMAKLGLWQVLEHHAGDLGLPHERFVELARQARNQAEMLDQLHASVRGEVFLAGYEVDRSTGRRS